MINFRKIDKFYLSGGWDNLPENIQELRNNNIKAVLDLQFVNPKEVAGAINYIKDKVGLDYLALGMEDSEFNLNLGALFDVGQEFLSQMETKFPAKREGILIKCAAGISRSPAMLINHFCTSRRMSYAEAINYIRAKEEYQGIGFGSSPNQFFEQYLKAKYK